MSKTLWNTIKIEVPNEMVNITKKDKVVVKKSLTKTNNVSKANKEPSIKIIPGNVNKPKIINDGKEWNVEELKIRMKKAKDLGKKNEGKELKKQIPKDKAAKIITKEIIFAQLKNKSKEDLLKLYRRIVIYHNPMLNTIGDIHKQFTDLNKDELLTKLNNLKRRLTNTEAASLLNISNVVTMNEKIEIAEKNKKSIKKI
jgi:predicted metallo-beta-lactamase superfamily hydrolase